MSFIYIYFLLFYFCSKREVSKNGAGGDRDAQVRRSGGREVPRKRRQGACDRRLVLGRWLTSRTAAGLLPAADPHRAAEHAAKYTPHLSLLSQHTPSREDRHRPLPPGSWPSTSGECTRTLDGALTQSSVSFCWTYWHCRHSQRLRWRSCCTRR